MEKNILHLDSKPQQEVGKSAIWSLSSAKPGNGVERLRDGRFDTYWQSDGNLPHLINIQFARKMTLTEIEFYVSFEMDESYAPSKVSVRVGNHQQDVHEVALLDYEEPEGWMKVPLRDSDNNPIRAFLVQLAILNNHQNGRDSHIRQIKIYSPVIETMATALDFIPSFTTIELSQHAFLK